MMRTLFGLLALFCCLPCPAAPATFTNPIVTSVGAPDPWMIQWHGSYYFTATTGRREIYVWKSPTLTGIDHGTKVTVWKGGIGPIWAPELHFLRGKWYIYYTDGANNGDRHLYVLESTTTDPQGPYVAKGRIFDPQNDLWAIDGTVLQTRDGRLFLIWSGKSAPGDPKQRLYIALMRNPWTLLGPRVLLSSPTLPWEGRINEGPETLQHGGPIFLIYSAHGSWTPDYCLGMLTNRDGNVLNPASWTKSPRPVFAKTDRVFGPGHCSFTLSPDGTQSWIVYHAKDTAGGGWGGRTPRAQPFTWRADGTPDFGTPVASGVPLPVPSGAGRPIGAFSRQPQAGKYPLRLPVHRHAGRTSATWRKHSMLRSPMPLKQKKQQARFSIMEFKKKTSA